MGGQLPTRQEIPEELKWRLEDIFATDREWETELAQIRAHKDEIQNLRGYNYICPDSAARAAGTRRDHTAVKPSHFLCKHEAG